MNSPPEMPKICPEAFAVCEIRLEVSHTRATEQSSAAKISTQSLVVNGLPASNWHSV